MIDNNFLVDYTLHIPIFNNDPTNKNICEYINGSRLRFICQYNRKTKY